MPTRTLVRLPVEAVKVVVPAAHAWNAVGASPSEGVLPSVGANAAITGIAFVVVA